SGWQGDIPMPPVLSSDSSEAVAVPVAKNADGSPVTGPVLARIKNTTGNTSPLMVYSHAVPYLPLTLDTKHATLTTRAAETIDGTSSPISTVPSTDWAWADCANTPFPGNPDPTKICLKNGFDGKLLYELVYTAKDPL